VVDGGKGYDKDEDKENIQFQPKQLEWVLEAPKI
jgi:hypothetical protein